MAVSLVRCTLHCIGNDNGSEPADKPCRFCFTSFFFFYLLSSSLHFIVHAIQKGVAFAFSCFEWFCCCCSTLFSFCFVSFPLNFSLVFFLVLFFWLKLFWESAFCKRKVSLICCCCGFMRCYPVSRFVRIARIVHLPASGQLHILTLVCCCLFNLQNITHLG